MKSFHLESGGAPKKQVTSAGCLLIVMGLAISVLVDGFVGWLMVLIGIALAVGGAAAES